jgi:hypothetical protein
MARGTIKIVTPQRDIAFTIEESSNRRRPVLDIEFPSKPIEDGDAVNFTIETQGGIEVSVNIQPA